MQNKIEGVGSSVPYRGPEVGCGWCAYEVCGGGPFVLVPIATHDLMTEKGPRQVCGKHLERGHWRSRQRRVSVVA